MTRSLLHRSLLGCVSAVVATSAMAVAAPAQAAPTASAELTCGSTAVVVTGFGRGQVLHVVGQETNFVVVRAETGGTVVFDNPGQAGRTDVVDCTTTTPAGRDFRFAGFFTPRG